MRRPVESPSATANCSDLLALAVHEFRTPVTVVAGYLRMLLRSADEPLTDRQRRLVEEAERSCGRLADLVAQLSDLSNLDGGGAPFNRADVPIFELVSATAAAVTEGRDRGVELQVRGAVPGAVVHGDPVRLRAVFGSILHAAAREQPGAGVVTVECAVEDRDGARWARVRVGDAGSIALLDSDEGAFDEFRGGIGMVLPIARRIVEAHGGRVWSPAEQKRAAMAVELPVKP